MRQTTPTDALDDPALRLTDRLCRIDSYWAAGAQDERAVAAEIARHLAGFDWLTVQVEAVQPGRPNVIALDCDPGDVELLIVGHIDTVRPVPGWSIAPFTVQDGRYYALGAADTKAGIAATLDAIGRAGPTRGVGYLFYCDEEYNFLGMQHFVEAHAAVRPDWVLSVCGAPEKMQAGCRAIIEAELCLTGHAGHASRPHSGASTTAALAAIITHLDAVIPAIDTPLQTTINFGAVRAGSLAAGAEAWRAGPPTIDHAANRIPNAAWALVEVRAGGGAVTAERLRAEVDRALAAFNADRTLPVEVFDWTVNFELPGYLSSRERLGPFEDAFAAVHQGAYADPGQTGYLDVALLVARCNAAAICMGPLKGNEHAPDEWVAVDSLLRYRDGVTRLLARWRLDERAG